MHQIEFPILLKSGLFYSANFSIRESTKTKETNRMSKEWRGYALNTDFIPKLY